MTSKRLLDFAISFVVSVASFPLALALVVLATLDTREFGLFTQARIGRNGEPFTVYKIRTMRTQSGSTTVTVAGDARITRLGAILRKFKLDELPQFWNVALGQMSLVGPRPDVAGYADQLTGDERIMLALRPGITGPATLAFRMEEEILSRYDDPGTANDKILWPAKVRVNRAYQEHGRLRDDFAMLDMTLRGTDHRLAAMLQRWDPELLSNPAISASLKELT